MQAVVLVGGEGTRLRPLTLTRPKPAITLVDRPFIRFMVEWLRRHGVGDLIMACGFQAEELRSVLGEDPAIRYLEEPEPLGTAGPIRLAADEGLLADRFLVVNGDVLTDLDLTAHLEAHSERGAVASLALYSVDDPSAYGLVRRDEDGAVTAFLEKPEPSGIDTDAGVREARSPAVAETAEINAGAYVLERAVADLIPPGRAVSIEREIFPRLVGQGLYGTRLDGYWKDIGTPERYLEASWDILAGAVATEVLERVDRDGLGVDGGAGVADGASLEPPALVQSGAQVAAAVIGPRAVLGPDCEVEGGARITASVLHRGCRVGADSVVEESILGAGVAVGARARVGPGAVIGDGARIEPEAVVGAEARVEPGAVAA